MMVEVGAASCSPSDLVIFIDAQRLITVPMSVCVRVVTTIIARIFADKAVSSQIMDGLGFVLQLTPAGKSTSEGTMGTAKIA